MRRARLAFVLCSLALGIGVASAGQAPPPDGEPATEPQARPAPSAEPAGEEETPMQFDSYQLVLLVRPPDRPDLPEERVAEIQAAHLAYLGRMGDEGHLVVAGPFGDQEDVAKRGLALYRVGSLEEARRLAEADPAVQAGRLAVEVMTWYTLAGALEFPLAAEARADRDATDGDRAD